jgi:glucosyl-3-phosphoglycerate synthase
MPARDEEATVGAIATAIRSALMQAVPLVDEVIMVDSRSVDGTAAAARAVGAFVVSQDEVTRGLPPMHGKGDAMWAGLAVASGDIVAFIDADVHPFDPRFVSGLLGPLLTDAAVSFVKGFYHRPLTSGGYSEPDGGGRVTEVLARPLLNLFWPDLAGFVQPLAGEAAGRREVLDRVPFVSGYGVGARHARGPARPRRPRRPRPGRYRRAGAPQSEQRGARPDGRADPAHRLVAARTSGTS